MILAHLRTAVLAAFPGLDAPKTAVFRVVRNAVERLNLQPVSGAADQTKDLSAVEVWPGVPGVTSDPTGGEEVLVAFVGADGAPVVIARGREGGPGSIPIRVRHDATTEILFVTRSDGVVRIGPPGMGEAARVPVAKAPPVDAIKTAVAAFATALTTATTFEQVQAAATALQSALAAIQPAGTQRLESA